MKSKVFKGNAEGMIYLYENEFDGFLTCIYLHYYEEKADEIYSKESYQPKLFEEVRKVPTDKQKANKVYTAITKISEEVYWDIFYTFLSNNPYKDCYLLKYLEKVFQMKKDIMKLHSHPVIYPIKRLRHQVGTERHRFLGILRFSEVNSVLYSSIEPEHNIAVLLADHFSDRLKNERFIIHDTNRKIAIISESGKWFLTDLDMNLPVVINEKEQLFQSLWKNYFDSVSIESRTNKKLQQSFVPKKYRKNIVEFS